MLIWVALSKNLVINAIEISFESARNLDRSQLTRAEAREGERTVDVVRKVEVSLHQDHPLAVLAGNFPSTFVSKVHTLVVEAVSNDVVNIGGQLAILNEKMTQIACVSIYILCCPVLLMVFTLPFLSQPCIYSTALYLILVICHRSKISLNCNHN